MTFSSADRFSRVWQMPMYDLIMEKIGPANTLIADEDLWRITLLPEYGQKEYDRFAFHDIDGDGVPELFLGWRYLSHFSWDVYKWWNGDMRYIGTFDSYAKYLAAIPGSNDVFTFDPVPNAFYKRTVKRISFADNMLQNETLMAIYDTGDRIRYLEGSRYLTALDNPRAGQLDRTSPHRSSLENFAGSSDNQRRVNFINRLSNYASSYNEIKTFDIYIVPPSAPLIMYVKTLGWTLP